MKEKVKRKMLRVNLYPDTIKQFKLACIQLDMQEYEGMEEAINIFLKEKQRAGKIYLPKPESE